MQDQRRPVNISHTTTDLWPVSVYWGWVLLALMGMFVCYALGYVVATGGR
jgi:hypothetical protein